MKFIELCIFFTVKMSFWDMNTENEEKNENSTKYIIEQGSKKLIDVLGSDNVLTTFRFREDYLVNYLTTDVIFRELIDFIFTNDDPKLTRVAVNLVTTIQSPLINLLVKNQELMTKMITDVGKYSSLQAGYMGQILTKAVYSKHHEMVSFLGTNIDMFAIITRNLKIMPVYEFVVEFLGNLSLAKQWIPWAYLFLLLKELDTANLPEELQEYKETISNFFKIMNPLEDKDVQILMCKIFRSYTTVVSLEPEMLKSIARNIHKLPQNIVSLEISAYCGFNENLYKTALKYVVENELSLLSIFYLKYVVKYCDYTHIKPFYGRFIDMFISSKRNTFFCYEFLNLTRALVKLPEFRDQYISKLKDIALERSKESKWKEDPSFVCYYLDLACVIDLYCEGPEWSAFREAEIRKWDNHEEGFIFTDANNGSFPFEQDGFTFSTTNDMNGEISFANFTGNNSNALFDQSNAFFQSAFNTTSSQESRAADDSVFDFPKIDESSENYFSRTMDVSKKISEEQKSRTMTSDLRSFQDDKKKRSDGGDGKEDNVFFELSGLSDSDEDEIKPKPHSDKPASKTENQHNGTKTPKITEGVTVPDGTSDDNITARRIIDMMKSDIWGTEKDDPFDSFKESRKFDSEESAFHYIVSGK